MSTIDIYAWQSVPTKVAALLPVATKLRAAHEKAATMLLSLVTATWHPANNGLTLYAAEKLPAAAVERYEKFAADQGYMLAIMRDTTPNWAEEILIKRGSFAGVSMTPIDAQTLKDPARLAHGVVSALVAPHEAVDKFTKVSYPVGFGTGPSVQSNPMYQPTIDVQQFNTALWRDARHGMINPYGPYGMHTPPPIAAAATSLTTGVANNIGSPLVRPVDLVTGFMAAGANPQTANLAGRTLGALANVPPMAQHQLQNSGLWGTVVSTVVPPLFGQGHF